MSNTTHFASVSSNNEIVISTQQMSFKTLVPTNTEYPHQVFDRLMQYAPTLYAAGNLGLLQKEWQAVVTSGYSTMGNRGRAGRIIQLVTDAMVKNLSDVPTIVLPNDDATNFGYEETDKESGEVTKFAGLVHIALEAGAYVVVAKAGRIDQKLLAGLPMDRVCIVSTVNPDAILDEKGSIKSAHARNAVVGILARNLFAVEIAPDGGTADIMYKAGRHGANMYAFPIRTATVAHRRRNKDTGKWYTYYETVDSLNSDFIMYHDTCPITGEDTITNAF